MSLTGNNILGGASGQTTGYDIEQSLRFNSSDDPYLSRTPSSASNRKTFTISCWIKKSIDTTEHGAIASVQGGSNDNDYFSIELIKSGSNEDRLRVSGWSNSFRITTRVFRDPSAWYHIVVACDSTQSTANDRVKVYVNGVQETDFINTTNISQDANYGWNQTSAHHIGEEVSSDHHLDGYLAEFYSIDGTALTPTSFGETNEDTNQWVPIKYTGSYGTNGFYLKFQDSSALGDDSSGNTNDFTPTNLAATDQVLDSPTNNFCTMNPLDKASSSYNTLKEGNLHLEATGQGSALSTFAMSSGKWYWECLVTIEPTWWPVVGFCKTTANVGVGNQNYTGEQTGSWGYLTETGAWYVDGSTSSTYTAVSAGDIMQFAIDMDAGKAWVGINNTWVNSGNPGTGANAIVTSGLTGDITPAFSDSDAAGHDLVANFGQDSSFAGAKTAQGNQDGNGIGDFYYTPPTGFKALCSDNLSDPSIADPTKHFNTMTYSGNASTRSITGVGFQPDFIWGKQRNGTNAHALVNSVTGNTKYLSSQRNNVEDTQTDVVTSFDSDGFSLGASVGFDMNQSGSNLVAWNWKAGGTASSNEDGSITSSVSANTTAGFSIVSYTGNSTAGATVGHGLSQAPELVIAKERTNADSWLVFSEPLGNTKALFLNETSAPGTHTTYWNDTSPSSTVVTLGSDNKANGSGTIIMYCFHGIDGYSKVGSYTGNGSADGTFIYTGFRPAFVMVKSSNAIASWWMGDTARETYNGGAGTYGWLQANASDAEADYTAIDHLSNGFKLRDVHGGLNGSGNTYLYLAFAESPFKYSNAR